MEEKQVLYRDFVKKVVSETKKATDGYCVKSGHITLRGGISEKNSEIILDLFSNSAMGFILTLDL